MKELNKFSSRQSRCRLFNYALYLSLMTASNRIHLIIILTLPLIILQDSKKLILSSAKIPAQSNKFCRKHSCYFLF